MNRLVATIFYQKIKVGRQCEHHHGDIGDETLRCKIAHLGQIDCLRKNGSAVMQHFQFAANRRVGIGNDGRPSAALIGIFCGERYFGEPEAELKRQMAICLIDRAFEIAVAPGKPKYQRVFRLAVRNGAGRIDF